MQKIKFFLLLLPTLLSHLVASQEALIAGKIVTDEKQGLPFANIYFKGSSIGTVSNEVGEFELQISKISDTLVASYIGYQKQFIILSNLSYEKKLLIIMKEEVVKLNELTITPTKLIKNPNEIVKTAINRIALTSNKTGHILKGYYRHINEQDGEYKQLIEAALTIYDPGFGVQGFKFNVDQTRRSHDLREIYLRNRKLDKNNNPLSSETLKTRDKERVTLNCWYNKNFRRQSVNLNQHGINTCGEYDFGVLDADFLKEHKFKLDTLTTFENEYVYVIKVLPSNSSKSFGGFPSNLIIPVGKLYIRTDDFAILKMEYQYILNPKKKKSDDFRTTYAIFGSGLVFQSTALYKEYNGYMYLSYLNTKDYPTTSVADRKIRTKTTNKVYNLTERTLLIREIVTSPEEVKKLLTNNNWDDQLYKESNIYDENFWNNYTTLVETPNQEKLRKDLEKKITLEEQFKKDQ